MRKPSHLLKILLAVTALLAGPAGASPVESAAEAFGRGEFAMAARDYETAIASTGPSAGLYFNLGLSLKKAGETGPAALALRRALMLDPRSVDTRMALSDLERSAGIPMETAPWTDRLVEFLPLTPLLVAGFVVFWAGMFLLPVAAALRRGPWLPVAGVMLTVAGAALFATAYLSDPRFSHREEAVVLDPQGASLSQSPAERSPAVAKLPAGAPLRLVRESGSWVYGELVDGRKGWLPKAAVAGVVPAGPL